MVSKISHPNSEAFLKKSEVFARQVLHPFEKEYSYESSLYHHHTHTYFSGLCYRGWSENYFDVDLGSRESKREEMGTIAAITTIAALIALYPAAQNWSEWSQVQNEISRVQANVKGVESEIAGENPALKDSIRTVYQREMSLLIHLKTEARDGFYLKSLFITSLTAIGYAAWFTAFTSFVVPYALAGAAFSTIGMIWRNGIRSVSQDVENEALELKAAIGHATEVFLDHQKV